MKGAMLENGAVWRRVPAAVRDAGSARTADELGDLRRERRRVALEHQQADLVEHRLDGRRVERGRARRAGSSRRASAACARRG